MSNRLTTLNISEDFYEYVSKKASAEERSVAAYIRNAVKVYSGYSHSTLAKKLGKDEIDLTDIEFPDEQ